MIIKALLILVVLVISIFLYKKVRAPLWSLVFNLALNITLISLCVNIYIMSMPLPDAEVTSAFQSVSGNTVVLRSFSVKWMDKYLIILETTKEMKEMLERLQNEGRSIR